MVKFRQVEVTDNDGAAVERDFGLVEANGDRWRLLATGFSYIAPKAVAGSSPASSVARCRRRV